MEEIVPDAVALLEQDHRTVEKLFDRFEKTGDIDIARRICQELRLHTTLEEDLVYPLLADEVSKTMAQRFRHDHRASKDLVDRIERLRVVDGGLRDLMAALKEVVLEHVGEEESIIFPQKQEHTGQKLTSLGDELVRRREGTISNLKLEMKKLRTGVNRLSRMQRRAISEDLETMTKADLQAYADELEIADVDHYRQTKDEMVQAIRTELSA
jgi:hemerythrin superfamily protein